MIQPEVEDVVKAIASDTGSTAEEVSQMYAEIWEEISKEARIMDYVAILVAKRVRENLRSMRRDRH